MKLYVSVEDLHVIILILAYAAEAAEQTLSFSRRPACYNTDTLSDLFFFARVSFVSVEDLHVIILILYNDRSADKIPAGFSRRPACYNTDT